MGARTTEEYRFTGYHPVDVLVQTLQGLAPGIEIVKGTSYTKYTAQVTYQSTTHLALFLGRASDWYKHSLNLTPGVERITLVIAGTHDSCLRLPVYALDQKKYYEPQTMRYPLWPLERGISDHFRKTHYGHLMLLGGLMCELPEAKQRLFSLPEETQRRILREVNRAARRRPGKPLKLFPS